MRSNPGLELANALGVNQNALGVNQNALGVNQNAFGVNQNVFALTTVKLTALPFFQHVNWHPDARELRRFAVAMLIGFAVLGLLAAWRAGGVSTTSIVLWSVGVFLAAAAFVPKLGRATYLAVYLPTSIIGYVVSHVLLALMFFLVITPLGIILRLMGKDLLQQQRRKDKTHWMPVRAAKNEDSYYRQF